MSHKYQSTVQCSAAIEAPKLRWTRLANGKFRVVAENSTGFSENAMNSIHELVSANIPTAKRLSFDTWHFKEDACATIFLLKWDE